MSTRHSPRRRGQHRRPRQGSTAFFVIGGIIMVALVVAIVLVYVRRSRGSTEELPLLQQVTRGPYEHIVLEQGEVESTKNVEIRCEIRARIGSTGPSTSIIDVIAEGTVVKEGDWLVTFDSSALEQEVSSQRIVVNTSEAIMIQAKATYDTALISKDEYIKGAYNEQKKTIENEIFVAEENLKKAQLSYESIKRLVSRGLLTSLQLEGEQFRVDAAQNELDLAKQKLDVLETYSQAKMLTQLESDIKAAEVKYRNEQDSHREEQKKLAEIEEQITACKVTAPQAGQVVYANVQSSRSGSEFVVEPGASVRERQEVIRLPDPEQMQVKAKINESRINLIHDGMPVTIRIDAFGDLAVEGVVTKVNKYSEPGNWWSSSAKEYVTIIKIVDPPPQIRVGLTAEVRIHVEHRADALQIPVQAVFERNGKTFCLVRNGENWDTREIVISSTNDKMVALDEERSEKLEAGGEVVMNPRKHLTKFDQSRFPESDDPEPPEGMDMTAANGSASDAAAGGATAGGDPGGGPPGTEAPEGGGPDGQRRGDPASVLQRFDSDGDGQLSIMELDAVPDGFRAVLATADSNGDGSIDAAELQALFSRMQSSGGGPGGPGGGSPGLGDAQLGGGE